MSNSKKCVHERLLTAMIGGSNSHIVHHYFCGGEQTKGAIVLISGDDTAQQVKHLLSDSPAIAFSEDEWRELVHSLTFMLDEASEQSIDEEAGSVLISHNAAAWHNFLMVALKLAAKGVAPCD